MKLELEVEASRELRKALEERAEGGRGSFNPIDALLTAVYDRLYPDPQSMTTANLLRAAADALDEEGADDHTACLVDALRERAEDVRDYGVPRQGEEKPNEVVGVNAGSEPKDVVNVLLKAIKRDQDWYCLPTSLSYVYKPDNDQPHVLTAVVRGTNVEWVW